LFSVSSSYKYKEGEHSILILCCHLNPTITADIISWVAFNHFTIAV
jgi:hypothetical protein